MQFESKVLSTAILCGVLTIGSSACNSVSSDQLMTPANFMTDLQASSSSAANSKILKESDQHPGVLVIYDSALNSDMAIDLSGNMNFSGVWGNLMQHHSTAQGEVTDYLANTGNYARAVQPIGALASGTQVFSDSNGVIYSQDQSTRDTDLQQADIQEGSQQTQAQAVAQQFQMSFDASSRLVTLAQKFQVMSQQGTLTPEDRAAIAEATMGVAGTSSQEISGAMNSAIQNGDMQPINTLMENAAAHLGMSKEDLVGKLLPSLGMQLNK